MYVFSGHMANLSIFLFWKASIHQPHTLAIKITVSQSEARTDLPNQCILFCFDPTWFTTDVIEIESLQNLLTVTSKHNLAIDSFCIFEYLNAIFREG